MATLSMVESVEAFLATIEKSGILSPEALAKVRESAAKADSPMALARPLVKDGTLTKWQASQLLYGYHQLVIGKFKLLDQLGAGEMGRVYLAEHIQMGRRHSLKVLSRRHVAKPDVLKRFLAEAQQVCGLDHRNLSHVYDINQDGDRYYLVMEYVEGQDLQRLVEKSGRLPAADAVDYVRQTAEGLAHAHENKLFHGDLKPSDLVVDESGTVKVLGIGQGRLAEGPAAPAGQDETGETASLAAAIHHAPEQRGSMRTINHKSDIYSLGSIFCYLLAGKAAADAAEAEKLLQGVAEVPAELTRLCLAMMAEKPDERPASMQAVIDELAVAGRSKPAAKSPEARPPVGSNGKDKASAAPPKAKKPPVARPLGEGASLPVAKALEEPAAAEEIAAAPAEEEPAPFGGFAIQTKGRVGVKPPVKSQPSSAAAVASADGPSAAAEKKTSYLPLIIGGSIGGGVLALTGVALLVYVLFFRGGESTEIADASKRSESTAAESTESAASPAGEGNPENNPGGETNPGAESNPTVEANPATEANPGAAATPAVATTPETKPANPNPATAAPMPAEAPKPAETPAAAPMPMPMPTATTPETPAPMPAPMPEPPKPEPPKPEPPKPAPPAGDPFVGFAKAVTLPKLGTGMGDIPPEALEPKVLGPCKVDEKALVIARLIGGEFATRGGRQKFEMAAANGGTALQDWEVSLTGGEGPLVIAKLSGKGGNLTFQWTPEAAREPNAPFLMNCAVSLSAGKGLHTVALREPVTGPPLAVEVEKSGSVKWLVENLPDPKSVYFEVTKLDGIAKQKYDPENVMRGSGEDLTVWIGPADDSLPLGLKLTSSISGKNVQVSSQSWIKFEGMKKAEKYSKKMLTSGKTTVTQQLNFLTQRLTALGNGRDERTEQQRSLINQQIEELNKGASQVDALATFLESLQTGGAVHFRVYYLAEENAQVDLVVTDGAAAAPEKK
jgi:serine/threonine protein kinase